MGTVDYPVDAAVNSAVEIDFSTKCTSQFSVDASHISTWIPLSFQLVKVKIAIIAPLLLLLNFYINIRSLINPMEAA